MNIIKFDENLHSEIFFKLLCDYFEELFRDDSENAIPANAMPRIFNFIKETLSHKLSWLNLCEVDSTIAGFIVAQVDTPDKDWCKRPDWGFIRELYVSPEYRRKGLARKLVESIEKIFIVNGIHQIYLTTDEASEFWESMGYIFDERFDEKNGNKIYIKLY